MKKLLVLIFLFCGLQSYSQEFSSPESKSVPVFDQVQLFQAEAVYIGPWETVRPGLSMPVPQLPERNFTITEVDFSKKVEKRQVNILAMMERKRYEKEKALVDLESPMPTLTTGEKALIEITNEIRMHDRSSNYDIYTGQKKIPAYEEMQTPLFRRNYSPYSGRSYVSPGGYYDPYLR